MTKEELAAKLNGREYRKEISLGECVEAKEAGLVVVFGASDDLMEFRGAINDECGAYEGTTAMVFSEGVLPSWESFDEKDDEDMVREYFVNKKRAIPITAEWDADGFAFVISATVPHATFDIFEDGDTYCRGIVFNLEHTQ